MTSNIIISIVIPSYKPGDYLFECLQSIDNQTISKERFEVILVLNGCNEPYKAQITNYIQKNNSVNYRLFQTDTPGVSNARNIGIDNAKGDFLTFIDDDDIITPNYLNDLLKVSSPYCIGCANSYSFWDNPQKRKDNFITSAFISCSSKKYSLLNYRKFLSAPWGKMIHRRIINQNRFPVQLKKSEDSLFCMLLTPYFKNMKLTPPDTFYYQREREGSAMHSKYLKMEVLKEHLIIEKEFFKTWLSHPFKYNFLFVLSRMVACGRNLLFYLNESNGPKKN